MTTGSAISETETVVETETAFRRGTAEGKIHFLTRSDPDLFCLKKSALEKSALKESALEKSALKESALNKFCAYINFKIRKLKFNSAYL